MSSFGLNIGGTADVVSREQSVTTRSARVISANSRVSTPKSSDEIVAWQQRCLSIQQSKDPGAIESIRAKNERSSRALKSATRAKNISTLNCYASASSAMTISGFGAASRGGGLGERASMQQRQEENASLSKAIQSCVVRSAASRTPNDADADDDEDEALEAQLDGLGAALMASPVLTEGVTPSVAFGADSFSGFRAAPEVAFGTVSRELDESIEQLAAEPSTEEETVAKFGLFETYLETVQTIRDQTIRFYEENADQFIGGAKTAADSAIKGIDSIQALGIVEDPSKWFVYWMLRKAKRNSESINSVLAKLRSQLQLLAQEDLECPCCLEPIDAAACVVLGCCHKVCGDCWDSWVALKGAHAFCPLCKHEEFVINIMQR